MKIMKMLIIFIMLSASIACTNSNKKTLNDNEFENGIKNGTDLWTSIHYRIISDHNKIQEIMSNGAKDIDLFLVEISLKVTNKGKEKAEGLNFILNEPTPYLQNGGTSNIGETNGELLHGEQTSCYYTYTFKTREELDLFVSKASIKMSWNEGSNKLSQILLLPLSSFSSK